MSTSVFSFTLAMASLAAGLISTAEAEPFRLDNLLRKQTTRVGGVGTTHTSSNRGGMVVRAQYEYSNGKKPLTLRPPTLQGNGVPANAQSNFSIQRPANDYFTGGAPPRSTPNPVTSQTPNNGGGANLQARTPRNVGTHHAGAQSFQSAQHPLFSSQSRRSPARVIRRGTDAVRGVFRRDPKNSSETPTNPDPTFLSYDAGPVSPDLHLSAARLMAQRGDVASAVQHYQSALRLNPRHRHALIGLARLQHRGGDLEGAIRTYRTALQRIGKDAVICNDLGLCLARAGRHDEATQMLRTAMALKPGSQMYRNNLAATFVDAGRAPDALRVLTEAHGESIAAYNVGYLLQQRGSVAEARQHFLRALRSDPSFEPARLMLDRTEPRIGNRQGTGTPEGRDFSMSRPQEATNGPDSQRSYVGLASASEPIPQREVAQPTAAQSMPVRRTPPPSSSLLDLRRSQPLGLTETQPPQIRQPNVFRSRTEAEGTEELIAPLPRGAVE